MSLPALTAVPADVRSAGTEAQKKRSDDLFALALQQF